jgi:hypothetical protein
LKGNQKTVAAAQSAEWAVVDPVNIEPEGVKDGGRIAACGCLEGDLETGHRAFAAFDDVSRPIAIGPSRLIRMHRGDSHPPSDGRDILPTEKNGVRLDLWNEHLHARMGIAYDDVTLHFQGIAFPPHLERSGLHQEWRGRPETVTELEPDQGEAEEKEEK